MSRWRCAASCSRPKSTRFEEHPVMVEKPSVLFVCVHNAGRSQMAAALLAHFAGDRIEVRSGGTEPAGQAKPVSVVALAEIGIDTNAATPKVITIEAVQSSDVVITMGC